LFALYVHHSHKDALSDYEEVSLMTVFHKYIHTYIPYRLT
jgi:hypothetical protein